MAGVSIRLEIDDARIRSTLQRLIDAVADPSDAMHDIAKLGEVSTLERFETQTGPDGQRWKPSLRAQIQGNKTLTESGHLNNSISSRSGRDFAEWGVNRPYAAIHQFGGVIKPKQVKSLRFRLANGGFVTTKSVTMPARPYLGISAADETEIVNILQRRIQNAIDTD